MARVPSGVDITEWSPGTEYVSCAFISYEQRLDRCVAVLYGSRLRSPARPLMANGPLRTAYMQLITFTLSLSQQGSVLGNTLFAMRCECRIRALRYLSDALVQHRLARWYVTSVHCYNMLTFDAINSLELPRSTSEHIQYLCLCQWSDSFFLGLPIMHTG